MSANLSDLKLDKHSQEIQKTPYESIYGGKGYSLNGPVFYLISGFVCLIIALFILYTEIYLPDVFENIQIIRPDIKFPFYGILLILTVSGAIIGIFFGIFGILWRNWKN